MAVREVARTDVTLSRSNPLATASGDSLSAYVFIPAEFMPELAAMAQSGRVQIINFPARVFVTVHLS
jgi:hypothetical protein